MSRGGARPGAGRKRTEDARVVLSCRVAPSTRVILEELANQKKIGIGAVLDDLCELYNAATNVAAFEMRYGEKMKEVEALR